MTLDDIRIIGEPLARSTDAEVEAAERELGARFPDGYRDYVTTLGEGILGGTLVRVYPPHRILAGSNNVHEWRARCAESWFWHDIPGMPERIQSLIILGDTANGDEFCFDASDHAAVIVLPRYEERSYTLRGGLLAAIDWMCSSGVLCEAFPERDFEPSDLP